MKPLFISALCAMSLLGKAQTTAHSNPSPKVSFGIKAGVNVANLKDNQTANTTSLTGFHGGILAHIHLSKMIAVQPEAIYSMQGAEYPNFGKQKDDYVNIPVLLQVMFGQGFRAETGPQAGILVNSKLERSSGGTTDTKYQMTNADFSWAFGLGYLSSVGLGVDARYNLGLSNIAKTTPHDVKNQVWQFGLFYQFHH